MGCWQAALRPAGASLAGVAVPGAHLSPSLLRLLCLPGAFGRLAGHLAVKSGKPGVLGVGPRLSDALEVLLNFF